MARAGLRLVREGRASARASLPRASFPRESFRATLPFRDKLPPRAPAETGLPADFDPLVLLRPFVEWPFVEWPFVEWPFVD